MTPEHFHFYCPDSVIQRLVCRLMIFRCCCKDLGIGSLYIGSFCIGSLEVWENIFLLEKYVIPFTCFYTFGLCPKSV